MPQLSETDIDTFYDDAWLRERHLGGLGSPNQTVTILAVRKGELRSQDGKITHKAVLRYAEFPLEHALCKTDARQIESFYGSDTKNWIGKKITLCVLVVVSFGKKVSAIRVLETAPSPNGQPEKGVTV
jgi:hypothetical protein